MRHVPALLLGAALTTLAAEGPGGATPHPQGAVARRTVGTGSPQETQDSPTLIRSQAVQRDAVAITVYNQNFGLVRDVRTLDLGVGRVALEFGDVASGIQAETVHIRSLAGPGAFRILEQNYQYDLLSPQKLLEKYVGGTVTVYRPLPGGGEEAVEAEVLSVNGGTILRINGEITFNFPGRIAFPEVPEDLIARPTLVWLLDSGRSTQQVEASYLTGGLDWKADYVMVVGEDDSRGSLTGWVTLTNQSGTSFRDATLKLVAGDVQRVLPEGEIRGRMMADALREASAPAFSEESFFEYHLYTLDRPTNLKNNEQKQVALLEADSFRVEKKLIFSGSAPFYRSSYGQVTSNQNVGVYLDFRNARDNNLGMPLPRGTVRVYKEDGSGAQQFIGEDRIDHTPRDELVRVKMGEAFDVVADRRQMDYTVVSSCVSESSWQIELRSHKDEPVTVQLMEPVGGDWEMLSSSHRHTKLDAFTFSFEPLVPANGTANVQYRVRVRWC